MPADPVPESPGAQWLADGSTTAADELGGGERLATTMDGSAAANEEMAVATGSSEAEAGVTDATPESTTGKPVVLEEQMALPE